MKSRIVLMTLLALLLTTASAAAKPTHIKAPLVAANDTGVGGFVKVKDQKGGPTIRVHGTGLTPGKQYTSYYYEASDCNGSHDELGGVTWNAAGNGRVTGVSEDPIADIGSVSVRLPDYGTLQACATLH